MGKNDKMFNMLQKIAVQGLRERQRTILGGEQMDGFMDKIAQKLGAQEAIRANAAADAAQIERLEAQVAQYDACIKEMRKLNLRNAENEQKLKEMLETVSGQVRTALEQSSEQIEQLVEKGGERIEQITEECIARLRGTEESIENTKEKSEEVEKLLEELRTSTTENMKKMEEMFRQADDFVHRENVKVYRNVQAATTEELEKQTQAVISSQQELAGKSKSLYAAGFLTFIASVVNMGLLIAHLAGLF